MDVDGSSPVLRLATSPIFLTHEHPIWGRSLPCIGDDVNSMAKPCETVRHPVCPHADSTLNGRILSDDADPHRVLLQRCGRGPVQSLWTERCGADVCEIWSSSMRQGLDANWPR